MTSEQETWRPVSGFAGYEVSNRGRVRRLMRSRVNEGKYKYRKWCFNPAGYPHVGLAQEGRLRTRLIHHLVAQAFLGPRPPAHQINHKNGQKDDPRVENLEYVTPAYNTQHAYDTGLIAHPKADAWHGTKTNANDVRQMRAMAGQGVMLKHLARQFGISIPRVSEIVNRKAWAHVE